MRIISIISAWCFLLISCKQQKAHQEHDGHGNQIYYTCSMDPQVLETKPGKCPICHMELTPVTLDKIQSNGLKLSSDQEKLANIRLQKARFGAIGSNITANGTVKENQNNIRFVNARVDGRIERLMVKTSGTDIRKGQIIYLIYSEMLAAVQTEFIQTWKQLSADPQNTLASAINKNAADKLLLWGLTEKQVEQLKLLNKPPVPYPVVSPVSGVIKSVKISEGSTVMEGDPLFELSGYKTLWVEGEFYAGETSDIKNGSKVEVYTGGSDEALEGRVEQVLPQVSPSSTVNLVRILILPGEREIRPGMQASVVWNSKSRKVLLIPSRAVLRGSGGNTVWVKNGEGIYEPRKVLLGEVAGSRAEILQGVKEGEEVVVSGAYLLQSEYVLRKGNNIMAGHNMSEM